MKTRLLPTLLALALTGFLPLRAFDNAPTIAVTSPEYCSDISGDTEVQVSAPGIHSLTVKCWKQGGQFGADSLVATVPLDASGHGSFLFPASKYPHGPVTLKISGGEGDKKDNCYLQLYNKVGVSWNEGLAAAPIPPGARGLRLVYQDDFSGPLSISSDDPHAKYYDHKPIDGSQDFSSIPFTGYHSPNNPFAQVGSYLRIRADMKKNSAGIIASEKRDGSGVLVKAPCYFECRFIGPTAKGSWPAFWLLSDQIGPVKKGASLQSLPVDELDIIEAVGGEGPAEPNGNGDEKNGYLYQITPHAWNQGSAGDALGGEAYKEMHNPANMKRVGIPSPWYLSPHTYGCLVTDTDTTYYCDNIVMGHHKTLPVSKTADLYFLINLATGGGWPVDISRYGKIDMYVDFVRVYALGLSGKGGGSSAALPASSNAKDPFANFTTTH